MSDDLRSRLLEAARSFSGLQYRLDPPPDGISTIDCSLLIIKACEKAGIPLPKGIRTAEQIRQISTPVPWDQVKPSDCLYFENTYNASGPAGPDGHIASHIGLSLGAGTRKMIDAHERPGDDVAETDIAHDYWQGHIFDARRLPGLVDAAPAPAPPVSGFDPWQFFTADAITRATSADMANVQRYWPKIADQMRLAGIWSRPAVVAVLATIAVEVGNRFEPIPEYGPS